MKNLVLNICLFYVFLSLCIVKSAFSNAYTGPVSTAMGGAGVSNIRPIEAITLNPALLGFIRNNHFQVFYSDNKDKDNDLNTTNVGLLAIDTVTSEIIPGALSYIHSSTKPNMTTPKITTQLMKLSSATREYNRWSFGFSFFRRETDDSINKYADHDLDFGLTYVMSPFWGLSAATYNLIEDGDERGVRSVRAGTYYHLQDLMKLAFDISYQKKSNENGGVNTHTGIALPFKDLDLMVGYENSSTENKEYFTTGFVWSGPRLSLAYSYKKALGSYNWKGHNLDLGVFF